MTPADPTTQEDVAFALGRTRSREDGVEDALGVDLPEHGNHEHDGGDDQSYRDLHEGVRGGGVGRTIPDQVVEGDEASDLLRLLG